MNIIIHLGGKGERFSKNGYDIPKPLIKIFEKTMIEYVIDNLNFTKENRLFIIYNSKLDNCIEKQNKYLYGYNLLIQSPNILEKEDSIVILKNGVYCNEIYEQIRNININTRIIM